MIEGEESGEPPEVTQAAQSMPVFPNIIPTSVRKSYVREFFDAEIRSESELEHLLMLLFHHPEVSTHVFHPHGQPLNALIIAAEKLGQIRIVETQGYWYEHPLYPNNFVRVTNPQFEWEEDLQENGQMLFRCELALTERERRRRENEETATTVASKAQPPVPTTIWQRLEHHYRANSAAYFIAGTLLGVFLGIAGIAASL